MHEDRHTKSNNERNSFSPHLSKLLILQTALVVRQRTVTELERVPIETTVREFEVEVETSIETNTVSVLVGQPNIQEDTATLTLTK